jgi:hypothetical protein
MRRFDDSIPARQAGRNASTNADRRQAGRQQRETDRDIVDIQTPANLQPACVHYSALYYTAEYIVASIPDTTSGEGCDLMGSMKARGRYDATNIPFTFQFFIPLKS